MYGDRLIIGSVHREIAGRILDEILPLLGKRDLVVTSIAGESGSGKTGAAQVLSEMLFERAIPNLILGQDDYFRLPPGDNQFRRYQSLDWVGPGEVRLDLMQEHVNRFRANPSARFTKPLMNHEENRLEWEQAGPDPASALRALVVEGTYVTILEGIDLRVMIASSHDRNRHNRAIRDREPASEFLERVLAIEHRLIREHRSLADLVIDEPATRVAHTNTRKECIS